MAYAEHTTVPFDRSLGEIVKLVRQAGAEQIVQGEDAASFAVQFRLGERQIRFRVTFPARDEMPQYDGRRRRLSDLQRAERWEQHRKQRARALLLVIKAKLESIESGIETTEQAFLANVVMADGMTVYERIAEPIALEYQTGKPDRTIGLLSPPNGG